MFEQALEYGCPNVLKYLLENDGAQIRGIFSNQLNKNKVMECLIKNKESTSTQIQTMLGILEKEEEKGYWWYKGEVENTKKSYLFEVCLKTYKKEQPDTTSMLFWKKPVSATSIDEIKKCAELLGLSVNGKFTEEVAKSFTDTLKGHPVEFQEFMKKNFDIESKDSNFEKNNFNQKT